MSVDTSRLRGKVDCIGLSDTNRLQGGIIGTLSDDTGQDNTGGWGGVGWALDSPLVYRGVLGHHGEEGCGGHRLPSRTPPHCVDAATSLNGRS